MKQKLGRQETQFFAYVQMRRLKVVRTADLAGSPLGLNDQQARRLLIRLARAGMIARVRRGSYLVPLRLPLGGTWSPDEILAVNTLMEECGGRYQICGPNAFNRYGFDEQVPNRLYAYNNVISGERAIGAVSMTLIKVDGKRLGDVEKARTPDGLTAVYSSRARTLVDAVYDWSRFDSLPRAFAWIRRELAAGRVEPEDLVKLTLRYGDKGTVRRIGALLEIAGVEQELLGKLEKSLKPSESLIPLVPTRPKRGTTNRRWGLVLNEES